MKGDGILKGLIDDKVGKRGELRASPRGNPHQWNEDIHGDIPRGYEHLYVERDGWIDKRLLLHACCSRSVFTKFR